MITHICPVCGRSHVVRPVRAALAHGRQLTCSPECESARRRRVRRQSAGEAASTLHTWVVASAAADLVRASSARHAARAGRR